MVGLTECAVVSNPATICAEETAPGADPNQRAKAERAPNGSGVTRRAPSHQSRDWDTCC